MKKYFFRLILLFLITLSVLSIRPVGIAEAQISPVVTTPGFDVPISFNLDGTPTGVSFHTDGTVDNYNLPTGSLGFGGGAGGGSSCTDPSCYTTVTYLPIGGVIKDTCDIPIPVAGVTVQLQIDGGATQQFTTGSDGRFNFYVLNTLNGRAYSVSLIGLPANTSNPTPLSYYNTLGSSSDCGSNCSFSLNNSACSSVQDPPKDPILNYSAVCNAAAVSLTFSATNASSYELFRADPGQGYHSLGSQSSPYKDTNVSGGSGYWYLMRAYNSIGSSDAPAIYVVPPSTSDCTPLTTTQNQPACFLNKTGSVTLNFSTPTGNQHIWSYQIFKAQDGNNYVDQGLHASPWTDSNVSWNTGYWYLVRAFTDGGGSDDAPAIHVSTPQCNNASCGPMNILTPVIAGTNFNASVTMNNTGAATWSTTGSAPYRLGSNPQDNTFWGLGRVDISGSVSPGQNYTFNFPETAPMSRMRYTDNWQMVQDNVQWFGDVCQANVDVVITQPTISTACNSSSGQISGTISWSNPGVTYVDISADPNFGSWWNKYVAGSYSTDFSGFQGYPQPNNTYYVRTWNGYDHSDTASFYQGCAVSPPPPAPAVSYGGTCGSDNYTPTIPINLSSNGANFFNLYIYRNGGSNQYVPSSGLYTDSGFEPGATVEHYAAQACNNIGCSNWTYFDASVPDCIPRGWHDGTDNNSCSTWGWACDPNDYTSASSALRVDFYQGNQGYGAQYIGSATAGNYRQDLVNANVCGGNGSHGFNYTLPASYKDGQNHNIFAYGINIGNNGQNWQNPLLGGSPKAISCPVPVPSTPSLIASGVCLDNGQASGLVLTPTSSGADHYLVRKYLDGSDNFVPAGGSFTDSGLGNNQSYNYAATACNSTGACSSWTTIYTFTSPVCDPPPTGAQLSADCSVTTGYACDASDYNQSIRVDLYSEKGFLGSAQANQPGSSSCGGSTSRGFTFNIPASLIDGQNHSIYAYGNNIGPLGDGDQPLSSTPKTINCPPPPPTVTLTVTDSNGNVIPPAPPSSCVTDSKNVTFNYTAGNNPTLCTASNDAGNSAWNFSFSGNASSYHSGVLTNPPQNQTYTLSCTNAGGTRAVSVPLCVNAPVIPPYLKTTGGDVHSNSNINVTGGPSP